MVKVLKWLSGVLVLSALIIWGCFIYVFQSGGTSVAFQTSDGEWAESEVLFKGRTFEVVVLGYEMYKIACNLPNVELQRITKKPNPLVVTWWFDDFNNEKWKVPLADHHSKLNGEFYYRKNGVNGCSNNLRYSELEEQARERSKIFIDLLRNRS